MSLEQLVYVCFEVRRSQYEQLQPLWETDQFCPIIEWSYKVQARLIIAKDSFAAISMSEKLCPYVVFLPTKRKQSVLRTIFGSMVPLDILKFSISRGISEKIYQKDLIENLDYSNKTIIEHLKELTKLDVLREDMEKTESAGRTVWVKRYALSDLGRWFALLLAEEASLSRDEKVEIVRSVFRSYVRWMRELSSKLDVKREVLREIFVKEMG